MCVRCHNITLSCCIDDLLTTVCTLPGFCILSAFRIWNTSTDPSVLHRSMAFTRQQNTPTRLTVSLHTHSTSRSMHHSSHGNAPSVHQDGFVARPTLDHCHAIQHFDDGARVGAYASSSPVLQLKLSNLLKFTRLQDTTP